MARPMENSVGERNPAPDAGRSDRRELAAVAAICIGALAARVVNLNASLWYDELITLVQSVRLPPSELLVTYGSLNNHVLYTWLAKGSIALFGESPAALRFPAVLFGVLSIFAAWRLFRIDGVKWAAVAAAALLAVSYHHVWFSQNARGYTGLLLFTTASAFYLNRAVNRQSMKDWIIYGALIAVAMLIHLSAAFFIAAQALVVFFYFSRKLKAEGVKPAILQARKPVVGYLVGAAIFLAIFSPMISGMFDTLREVSTASAGAERQVAEWKNPLWTIVESLRSFGALAFAAPIAIIFIALGVVRLWSIAPLIAAPYLLHAPLTLAILTSLSMRIWPRYFFTDIAFLFMALVVGAFWFAEMFASRVALAKRVHLSANRLKALGFAFMIAASLPLLVRNYGLPKQDFSGALAFIEERAPKDAVKTAIGLSDVYFNEYMSLNWPSLKTVEELEAVEREGRPVWVTTAFPSHARAYYPEIQERLDTDYEVALRLKGTLSGGDIIIYRSRKR